MFKILVKLKSAEEFKVPDLTVVDVTLEEFWEVFCVALLLEFDVVSE